MQIEMLSAQAKLTSLPTPVAIGLKVDQPPRVSLSFTGVRQRITPMAKIPLTILARDDYGVADMDLATKAEFIDANKKPQTLTSSKSIARPDRSRDEQEIQQKNDFDVTGVEARSRTRSCRSAPAPRINVTWRRRSASSRPATFRIVAPEELFREILLRQQGERAKFRKQIDEAAKHQRVARYCSHRPKRRIGSCPAASKRSSAKCSASTSDLAESIEEMRLNGLGTPEAYKLMQDKVLAPLKQMDTDLMIPQRDALDALGSAERQSSRMSPPARIRSSQRMNQILKQMSQWDSFVDVLNQLNEIIRLQEGVKVGTEDLKTKQTEDIFDK